VRKAWIPNAITLTSLALGVVAVGLASDPASWATGCFLIGACAFLDLIDGKVARALKASSSIGVQLDSLADLVAFGIGPAILTYHGFLREWGALGMALCALFSVGCAFRLARFNVLAAQPKTGDGFVGCPAPVGAVTLTAILLTASRAPFTVPPVVIVAALAAIAAVMVSVIPYKKDMPWGHPLFAAVVVMLLVMFREYFVLVGGVIYMLLGPVLAAVSSRHHHHPQDRAA
jgi:CDP-diacylglycerol--serine O-phosphatidyltransferase